MCHILAAYYALINVPLADSSCTTDFVYKSTHLPLRAENTVMASFGKAFREKHFSGLEAGVVPVNHGSFGLSPQVVMDEYFRYLRHDFLFPDRYARFELDDEYVKGLQALSPLLNTDYRNLAIQNNATSAVNTILRSFPFKKGDKVVYPNTGYLNCVNTIQFLKNYIGIEPVIVDLTYPEEDKDVVRKFEEAFAKGGVRLALFDVVTSIPGVLTPFEELVALCKKYGVVSLVDGAHSLGLLPIDLTSLQPDFYVSNLHKWLFVPRGCSVLYVAPQHHRLIQPLPINRASPDPNVELSEEEELNLLILKFAFSGTSTYASVLTIPVAIKFRNEVCGGEDAIRKYTSLLAVEVGKAIASRWGTEVMENSTRTLTTSLVNVEVPLWKVASSETLAVFYNSTKIRKFNQEYLDFVQRAMAYDHKTYVQVFVYNGKLYARWSCQVYNELGDFEYASDVVLETFKKYFESEVFLKYVK